MQQVQPGDIIRSLNGNHVMLVSEVGYDRQSIPQYFKYLNSTEHQGSTGIREGSIVIKSLNGHILDQAWIGDEWTIRDAKNYPEDTRIVRLRIQSVV